MTSPYDVDLMRSRGGVSESLETFFADPNTAALINGVTGGGGDVTAAATFTTSGKLLQTNGAGKEIAEVTGTDVANITTAAADLTADRIVLGAGGKASQTLANVVKTAGVDNGLSFYNGGSVTFHDETGGGAGWYEMKAPTTIPAGGVTKLQLPDNATGQAAGSVLKIKTNTGAGTSGDPAIITTEWGEDAAGIPGLQWRKAINSGDTTLAGPGMYVVTGSTIFSVELPATSSLTIGDRFYFLHNMTLDNVSFTPNAADSINGGAAGTGVFDLSSRGMAVLFVHVAANNWTASYLTAPTTHLALDRHVITTADSPATITKETKIAFDASGGTITINLPDAATYAGGDVFHQRKITVDNHDASNTVTLAAAGSDTINGGATHVWDSRHGQVVLTPVGTNWNVVAHSDDHAFLDAGGAVHRMLKRDANGHPVSTGIDTENDDLTLPPAKRLRFQDNGQTVDLRAAAAASASYALELPPTAGTDGQIIQHGTGDTSAWVDYNPTNDALERAAIHLDGINDFLRNDHVMDQVTASHHWQIGAWIKLRQQKVASQFLLVIDDGDVHIGVYTDDNDDIHGYANATIFNTTFGATGVTIGTWHFWTISYDLTNLKVHIDGTEIYSGAFAAASLTATRFLIGAESDPSDSLSDFAHISVAYPFVDVSTSAIPIQTPLGPLPDTADRTLLWMPSTNGVVDISVGGATAYHATGTSDPSTSDTIVLTGTTEHIHPRYAGKRLFFTASSPVTVELDSFSIPAGGFVTLVQDHANAKLSLSTSVQVTSASGITSTTNQYDAMTIYRRSNSGATGLVFDVTLNPPRASMCMVTRSAAQVIGTGLDVELIFDSAADIDTQNYHSHTVNNTRLTVPKTGFYLLTASTNIDDNAIGVRHFGYSIDGGAPVWVHRITPHGTVDDILAFATVISLTANNYIQVEVKQDSGGNLSINNSTACIRRVDS